MLEERPGMFQLLSNGSFPYDFPVGQFRCTLLQSSGLQGGRLSDVEG